MERMLADYEKAHGVKWMSLRYFNAAGCDPDGETGEWHEPETHLIPRALMAAMGQIPALEIFGDDYPTPDGTCIRDYVHVTDLADAHVRGIDFLTNRGQSQSINIGTGKGFSIQTILNISEKVLGKQVPHIKCPRRKGDPAYLLADNHKAVQKLNWIPKNSVIEKILTSAWKWEQKKVKINSRNA
jgi:UDP-glucose 4-epimerase